MYVFFGKLCLLEILLNTCDPFQDASLLEPLEDGLNALLNIEVSMILSLLDSCPYIAVA